MRRLADEDVVEQDVGDDQRHARREDRKTAERAGDVLAEKPHEPELVELSAQREEHREPDEGREDVPWGRRFVEAFENRAKLAE